MSIGIIDYGACNILSVYNSLYRLGEDPIIIKDPKLLSNCEKLVIPGVGSASNCIKNLKKNGLFTEILNFHKEKKPILGICLGFQIFAKNLFEDGKSNGLGFINADVIKLNIEKKFNIGWCEVFLENRISRELDANKISKYYFCHSFFLKFNNEFEKKYCVGITNSNYQIPSLFIKDNLIGCQFHPEKSQKSGEVIIRYFLDL